MMANGIERRSEQPVAMLANYVLGQVRQFVEIPQVLADVFRIEATRRKQIPIVRCLRASERQRVDEAIDRDTPAGVERERIVLAQLRDLWAHAALLATFCDRIREITAGESFQRPEWLPDEQGLGMTKEWMIGSHWNSTS